MCGIIGYCSTNSRNARKIVIEGLKKMEYRGYDSWGIGIKAGNSISVEKKVGSISDADQKSELDCNYAIGHTRWATHGKVTEENAHPHLSYNGNICVVHNGIIENYRELKKELQEKNYEFKSDTDTEVIPHLIEEHYRKTNDFQTSVKKASECFRGNYAFIAMCNDFEGLIGVKNGAPLLIGYEKEESFITSDVVAFIERTKKVTYLDDNEMVVLG